MSTTPDPWAADTPELLKNTLTHLARARVTVSGGTDIQLDVIDGSVSFDEGRTPRVTADLSCAIPADRLTTDAIDPRLAGRRVALEVGYLRPDGTEDVQPIADLMLRGRSLSYPENTMRLTAASDEAKLLDVAPSLLQQTLTETGAQNAITALFTSAGLGMILQGDATADTTAFSIDPVSDRWDAVEDICDQIGADFYATGRVADEYMLTYRPTLSTTVAHTITTGNGGTVTSGSYAVDRDEWYNAVLLEHTWSGWNNVENRVAVLDDATGTFAPTAGNRRVLKVTRNTPTTSTKAHAAAQKLANRQATKGRAMGLTAISAYWVRPGDTISALLPDIDPERHLVSSVTFRLGEGLMELTTRLPE